MVKAILPEAEFIRLFREAGPSAIARHTGQTNLRQIFDRRRSLERKHHIRIDPPKPSTAPQPVAILHPERVHLSITDGVVLVGGDGHYWPGDNSVAHRAFVKFARELRPQAIIYNGDAFDGASISRHPPIGWTMMPTVQQEIEACQDRLSEIERAKPMSCRLIWSLGNHDKRFETRIATVAPELALVHGTSLKDHFPAWEPAWSVFLNGDGPAGVVIKHRFKGGLHAPHNNTLWSGRTVVTGHLHSAKVYPFSDYNGDRYGVDAGCLADTDSAQFVDYTEDNPKNWRSGFCVLTFVGGKLLMPELVMKWDETHVQWRGSIIEVPMTDDDELPDYVIGGGTEKKKRQKAPMKPPEAKRNRPVIVRKKLSQSRREHYAREDR